MPSRRLLFDVKTIHGGTAHYASVLARTEHGGAVRHRETAVMQDYVSHARALDARFYPDTTAPGPILSRLRSFTQVRGLVFGHYGEASADVHALISLAASKLAGMRWQLAGAWRALSDRDACFLSFLVSRASTEDWFGYGAGDGAAQASSAAIRWRLGVPRAVVQARLQREPRMRGEQELYAPAPSHADFYAYHQSWGSNAAAVGA
eukprot:CAMPEP_0184403842 /NCGR_PEP_ID=MMETSP0007-20130409/85630_1 /TAXON_ID=97485 /ORGANISM="Prymnesium parvum, Strain Texoma1" /LENGTH=205 /DNA_ID=CAMNT_0026759975 /DNA_START=1891 /DNA_END=2507 /DNA_ORIENTATION=-